MQESLFSFLVFGLTLGASVGVIPGPFLAIVLSQTLKYNLKEGLKVASSVLITDPLLITLTVLILSRVAELDFYMGIIYLVGALYIVKLAYGNITIKDTKIDIEDAEPQSLRKGIMMVLLTPTGYLFWLTLGAPKIIESYQISIFGPALFLGGLYFAFIGSNMTIAWLVNRSADFLQSKAYTYMIKFTGLAMLFFAGVFTKNGLELIGAI